MNVRALSFSGIIILSVSKQRQHERSGEGVIDDTGLGITNPHSTTATSTSMKSLTTEERELHTKANGILQFFPGLLIVIGVDLHSGKSVCFLLFHRWSGGKSSLLKIYDDRPKITPTHPLTGTINIVPIKERDEPHRALGWMMTIDGKSSGQYKTLQNKARQFASAIYRSRMRRQYASITNNCYYIASIGYTLASTKNAGQSIQCNSESSHMRNTQQDGHAQKRSSEDCLRP
jgi:hypothetical protein